MLLSERVKENYYFTLKNVNFNRYLQKNLVK